VLVAAALLGAACGSDKPSTANTTAKETTVAADPVGAAQARVTATESGVTTAQDTLTTASTNFCSVTGDYVQALDRYGKLFSTKAATVGDIKTVGADLIAPRDAVTAAVGDVSNARTAVASAQQELLDAQAALAEAVATASSTPTSSTNAPATSTTTTIVPAATIERVKKAEADLAQAGQGITDATTLKDATVEYNSAAFALEIAWLRLIADAGCLSNDQQKQAVDLVTGYTTTLQNDLTKVGYYSDTVDGIYGPNTVAGVKKLQKDAGLTETGYVDKATGKALDDKLSAAGLQEASAELTRTAAVQTILTLTGFWTGAIDGKWTDELTVALQAFQSKLGVAPTGEVDAATLAAFQQAVATLKESTSATTTTPPETPVTTTAAPAAPTTVATTPAATTVAPTATG